MGLRAYFLNPISCPPALGYGKHGQGLYRFLNQVRLPRGLTGLAWLGFCRRQPSYDNDEFSTFALTSSGSFSFFREHPLTISIVPPPPPPPPPGIKAFYFSTSSSFIRLAFCPQSLLALCDTLLEVAFFILFLGLVRLSSFYVFLSNIARRYGEIG